MTLTQIVETLLLLLGIYLAVGLIVAIWLVVWGLARLDPVARDGSSGFKILVLPGLCVFWPIFVSRLLEGRQLPEERNAHRRRSKI